MNRKPCSLQDFIDYLIYITYDAENLQFYLWLVDYMKRFESLSKPDQLLSPDWKFDDSRPILSSLLGNSARTLAAIDVKEVDKEDGLNETTLETILMTPSVRASPTFMTASVAEADSEARRKWQACKVTKLFLVRGMPYKISTVTEQPFREEITRIISHYIAPGATRELNLSHKDRDSILHALQYTTHPSAFSHVRAIVELTLRNQSHPNFIRWSICNGNKPRVIFLRSFAVANTIIGLLIAILLALSRASRWWRIFAGPELWFGIGNIIAAYKGLCVLLYRKHTRDIHPWELDSSEQSSVSSQQKFPFATDEESGQSTPKAMVYSLETRSQSPRLSFFGEANSFEKEPWIEKWKGQPLWKRIDAKKVWVQEQGMRVIQNKIVVQAHAWATLVTIPLLVVFVSLPKGNYF